MFQIGKFVIYFFPKDDKDFWGYREDWYDNNVKMFGIGPFLLIVKIW